MQRMNHFLVVPALGVLLSACAEHPPAAIEDRSVKRVDVAPEVRQAASNERQAMLDKQPALDTGLPQGPDYRVQQGDTLYSVAFRLGMDYRTLARFNEIEPPFTILVGELLRTTPLVSLSQPSPDTAVSTPATKPVTAVDTQDRKKPGDREPRCDQADECPGRPMAVARNRHRESSVCW